MSRARCLLLVGLPGTTWGGWLCLVALGSAGCQCDAPPLESPQPLLVEQAAARARAEPSKGSGLPSVAPEPRGILLDGSSTVYPISEAVAEEFRAAGGAQVSIGVSGTRSGLEKLCNGQVAISGASRPIRPAEAAACQARGVGYVELPIAYDGIAVVVHPDNDWVTALTVSELATLWRPEAQGQVVRWNQLRAEWPDAEIHLLGPGVDSGTYDYFTLAVVGREHASRGDYGASEDDHRIARGVSQDPLALGFFGYAYYAVNRERLRLIGIDDERNDNGRGAVWPSAETVRSGSYSPLSRPIFLYVSLTAAERPEVAAFVSFYLEQAARLAEELGYVALSAGGYRLARQRFASRRADAPLAEAGARVGGAVEATLVVE